MSSLFGAECIPRYTVGAPAGSCPGLLTGLIWPVPTDRDILITAYYRPPWYPTHNAIDITYKDAGILPVGTPILATAAGKVVAVDPGGGSRCGIYVVLFHDYIAPSGIRMTFYSGYCHLSQVNVSIGQSVSQGEVIAFSGNTGHSTGPHLHFYINISGRSGEEGASPVDPCTVLPNIPGRIFWYDEPTGRVSPGCSPSQHGEDCDPAGGGASPPGSSDIVRLICEMFLRVNPDRTAANIAVAVAAAESGLNPRAVNVNQGSTGCRCSFECRNEDWGLFQINLQCHADRLRNLGIIRRSEDLFDPATNIAAAILISDAGRNWRPWVTYLTGAYQRFFLKPGYTCS